MIIQGSTGNQHNSGEGKTYIMQIINDLGQKTKSGVLIFEEHVRRSLLRAGEAGESSGLAEA